MKAVAVVKDLFFVARIRETARLAGSSVSFARTLEELESELAACPDLVLLDLTTEGCDLDGCLTKLVACSPPVAILGFTTHTLAGHTQPLHSRCHRVVTRETLTRELGQILTHGIGRVDRTVPGSRTTEG